MPGIKVIPNADDLVRRYIAGESMNKLRRETGINMGPLRTMLVHSGVSVRGKAESAKIRPKSVRPDAKMKIPNIEAIAARYLGGESLYSIANSIGITRAPILREIKNLGVDIRGCSRAGLLRASKMTPEERRRQASASHAALRGTKVPPDRLAKHAAGRERAVSGQSVYERQLIEMLAPSGVSVRPQKAFGKYNLDIAIEESCVAVEIFGGGFHKIGHHGATFFERSKYILDQGWDLIIVWSGKRSPITIGCANYVLSHLESIRGLPSGRREYRVIWGNGKNCSVRKGNFNDAALVERLGASHKMPGNHN